MMKSKQINMQDNIPVLNVNKLVNLITNSYRNIIDGKLDLSVFPSVMLWGAPGVGKSQAIRQIAQGLENETGKRVVVTDVRLLLFNPVDLRGIPTSNEDKTLAVWLKPKIFEMDESVEVINILFLDEISAAPISVQAAAYQITLDKQVGEHKLPSNCLVVAAGNRVQDKSVAYKMPKALANRLMHFEIEVDYTSWHDWALAHDIHELVVSYLDHSNNELMADESKDELAYATPRSWEMVSNILKYVEPDINNALPLIGGLVGMARAIEFKTYVDEIKALPDIKKIFAGRETQLPKGNDCMFNTIKAMSGYAKTCSDDLVKIGNSLNYAKRLPVDYQAALIEYYKTIKPNYEATLKKMPEYLDLVKRVSEI